MQHQQQHMLACRHFRQQLQHELHAAAMLMIC
jgi:hypothetical protein